MADYKIQIIKNRLSLRQPQANSYFSEKVAGEDENTFRHKRIILRPNNKNFQDIVLENIRENEFHVVAEFVEIVG